MRDHTTVSRVDQEATKRFGEAISIIHDLEQAVTDFGEMRQQLSLARAAALIESENTHSAGKGLPWDMKEATPDTPGHGDGHGDSPKSLQSVNNSGDLSAMFERLRDAVSELARRDEFRR